MYISKVIYLFAFILTHTLTVHAQDYKIQPGDLININIFQHPELEATVRVSESGRVNVPLIGAANVQGKSETEAEDIIEQALTTGGFIISPQVSVVVTEYSGRTASVLGKVNNPGEFQISSGDTIMDVISKAGGLTEDGSPSLTLYRKNSEPQTFNLYSESGGTINQNSQIQPGDVVLVAQADVFYTYGEVNKPSEYILRDKITVMQAISISGGLTDKASEKGIYIIRNTADGGSETYKAKLDEIVQPSDVIMVKESLF